MSVSTVVLLSGGLDSTTALYHMRARGYDCTALSVVYGQRHRREVGCAREICARIGVPHWVIDVPELRAFMQGSSQTSDIPVPHGHYEDESMRVTVVPNRNMVLLSLATAFALSNKVDLVTYAAHAGDHAVYPDCRPEFVARMRAVMEVCAYHVVGLSTPFIAETKTRIVQIGADLHVPFQLTYSCYEGEEMHCGLCATCYERRLSFLEACVYDPTYYRHPMPDYKPTA